MKVLGTVTDEHATTPNPPSGAPRDGNGVSGTQGASTPSGAPGGLRSS